MSKGIEETNFVYVVTQCLSEGVDDAHMKETPSE